MLTAILALVCMLLAARCWFERAKRIEAEGWAEKCNQRANALQIMLDRREAAVFYAIRSRRHDEIQQDFEAGCG